MYQLSELSEFSGAREKISASQITQLAELIAADYHFLKVTEVMLFFRKFKKGAYGEFYGAVDPITIMRSLRSFQRERGEVYAHRKADDEPADDRECITYEEYVRELQGSGGCFGVER